MSDVPFAVPETRLKAVTGRVYSTLSAVSLGIGLYRQASEAYKRWTAKPDYQVTLLSNDMLYGDVLLEVLDAIPSRDRRALQAGYHRSSRADVSPLSVVYSGSVTHVIDINSHPIEVTVVGIGRAPGQGGSTAVPLDSSGDDDPWWDLLPKKLTLKAIDEAGRDAILGWLGRLADRRRNRGNPPQIHLLTRWGGWTSVGEVAGRPPESVSLGDGQMERIVDDLGEFLGSQAKYDRVGMPWHRGYLFAGPPGGGKSSVARVLAGIFNLDLWYMPLSDIESDTDILRQISEIRGGILLIEDVDVFSAATSRDAEGKGLSLSGVLNALDGVATPAGLVTIMATNAPDDLDEALVRPGRVDLRETFGPIASMGQAEAIFANAYREHAPSGLPAGVIGMMPAEVVGIIKAHLDDPAGALRALYGRVELQPPELDTDATLHLIDNLSPVASTAAYKERCPACGAPAGEFCRSLGVEQRALIHAARIEAAEVGA